MAYILLVDPDELAQRAMGGILARGKHRVAMVVTAQEAEDFIRRQVKVDLVIAELKLKGETIVPLIQQLKADACLRELPLIVYTAHGDRESVKRVLNLGVQNFLLKPYRDETVFAEIEKALAHPWRQQLFLPERSVCQSLNCAPEQLRAALDNLRRVLERAHAIADPEARSRPEGSPMSDELLLKLITRSQAMGANGVHACLVALRDRRMAGKGLETKESLELLHFAARLLHDQLNPLNCPEAFMTEEEVNGEAEALERARWATAAAEGRCPLVDWPQLQREIDALAGCPVIDSIAASYQMSANGRPTSLSPLLDLVQKDPGLTAQILIAANRLKKNRDDGGSVAIEEPRMAIGILGELRLASIGGGLIAVPERMLQAPPHMSWPSFRMFQLATARMARFACGYLEMPGLEAPAYTAGLLHDIGKLILARLHPFALQAIHDFALKQGWRLAAAERHFLGVTTHEMAAYFAEKQGLPRRFANVMRWMDQADQAAEDADLVAIVSLARDLCRHNHVGFCGDTPKDDALPLEETPEWSVLRNRVYLNFDLKKFEKQAHLECLQLKRELQGTVGK